MAAMTRIAILFCGQGMSTLIEYYAGGDEKAAPDNLVLLDFGGNQKYSEAAANYVVEKLQRQKKAKKSPKFDLIVISHQDGDHLSLLGALTGAINEAGLTVSYDSVYAGGTAWSAANKKRVTAFLNAMETDEDDDVGFNSPYESNYSGAKKRSDLESLCHFGQTYVRVFVSGLKLSKCPQDITRNASSAVIVVENGESTAVLPGDATYHTMRAVNEFYTKWKDKPLVPEVFVLEVPHHGALRTAVENYTAQRPLSKLDFSIIEKFAGFMSTNHIVASAGPMNTHCHPILEVLDVFHKNLSTESDHTYVAYVFDRKKSKKQDGWDQFDSDKGVWTTVEQIDDEVKWGDQLFDIEDSMASSKGSRNVSFRARGRLDDLMAAYAAAEASGAPVDLSSVTQPRARSPANDILRAPPPPDDAT